MNAKLLATIGLGVLLAFNSCKKEDDKKEEPATSIVGTWKLTACTEWYHYNGFDTLIDYYADMEPCQKDDLYRYNADKTITYLNGATKCDPNDPDSETAKWLLTDNSTKLTISFPGGDDEYKVAILNATTLKLYYEDPSTRYEETYTRQ